MRQISRLRLSLPAAPDTLRTLRLLGLVLGLPLGAGVWLWYGPAPAVRFLLGLIAVLCVEHVFIAAMIRRIGPEKRSLADALTLSRAVCAAALAALVISGVSDRAGPAGWIAWLLVLYAATLSDWVDGPLARRAGPTLLGGVLDIESDSWLTLWAAVGAVVWGGLPWLVLVPPIVRYAQPMLALPQGELPAGGGPWWGRVTGVAQMALFILALAPIAWPLPAAVLGVATGPISLAQLAVMLLLLHPKLRPRRTLMALM
jgi:phosphatidylglycerophosphate synthase